MPRIVHVSGTSGSGKSTAMRAVMARGTALPRYLEGRKAPLGYSLPLPEVAGPVFVVGAYEAPSSGGCDTFGGDGRIERLYTLIQEYHAQGYHVLYEGVMMMNHTRGIALFRAVGDDMRVINLTTTLEDCLASVRARRVEVGKPPEFSTTNTEGSYRRAGAYARKLRAIGCRVTNCSREAAPDAILSALRD